MSAPEFVKIGAQIREKVAEVRRAGASLAAIEGWVMSGLHDVGERDTFCDIRRDPELAKQLFDEEAAEDE